LRASLARRRCVGLRRLVLALLLAAARVLLEPGPIGWVHGAVDGASMAGLRRAEADFIASVAPANVNAGIEGRDGAPRRPDRERLSS
jgi:hypothetical protein